MRYYYYNYYLRCCAVKRYTHFSILTETFFLPYVNKDFKSAIKKKTIFFLIDVPICKINVQDFNESQKRKTTAI